VLDRLAKIKELKGKFANGRELSLFLHSNAETKREIEVLSKHFFNKKVQGCGNCYFDAYVKLISMNTGKENS